MALKWIGHTKGAEGLFNIPARDLNDNEVERFGGEAALLATGLYAKAESPRSGEAKMIIDYLNATEASRFDNVEELLDDVNESDLDDD